MFAATITGRSSLPASHVWDAVPLDERDCRWRAACSAAFDFAARRQTVALFRSDHEPDLASTLIGQSDSAILVSVLGIDPTARRP